MKKTEPIEKLSADDARKTYAKVKMALPWAVGMSNDGESTRLEVPSRLSRGSVLLQEASVITTGGRHTGDEPLSGNGLEQFVEQRSEVHKEFIRQEQITKRWGIAAACLCVVASAIVLVFAPEGRETTSYVVGAVLVVLAAGAFGFTKASASHRETKMSVSKD